MAERVQNKYWGEREAGSRSELGEEVAGRMVLAVAAGYTWVVDKEVVRIRVAILEVGL